MNILVTGCNGFIGSSLVEYFSDKKWHVFGVDKEETSQIVTKSHYTQANLSMNLESKLETILNETDWVIHCAGKSSVLQSVEDPHSDFLAGPLATHQLLESMRKFGKKTPSFIFLSSAAVYGNPVQKPTSEECPTNPISPYGFHKLQCEQIAEMYSKVFGIHSTCLRIFSAYGSNLKRQVIYDLGKKIYLAKNDDEIKIFGSGNESRDFIHVSDICKTIDKIITQNKLNKTFEILNLASGKETSIKELVEIFSDYFNKKIKLKFTEEKARGMPENWCADISKLNELEIFPQTDMKFFLKKYSF